MAPHQMDRIEYKLDKILLNLSLMENQIMASIQDIVSAVTAETDLVKGVATIIDTLSVDIKTLVDAAGTPIPGLDALLANVQANSAALTAAVSAGTAAESLVSPAPVVPVA